MVGLADCAGKGRGRARLAPRARQLNLFDTALDPNACGDAVWLVAAGGVDHVSLLGSASKHDRPKKTLSVSDGQDTYVEQLVPFKLSAGPPARLRWLSAPPNVVCDNSTKLQIFGRLEARLEDAYGNPAVARGALIDATLSAQADYSTAAKSKHHFPTKALLADLNAFSTLPPLPRLEGALDSNTIDMSSAIVIGPVAVAHGTGRGSHYLRVKFWLLGREAAELPVIELPDDLHVYFVDTSSLSEGQNGGVAARGTMRAGAEKVDDKRHLSGSSVKARTSVQAISARMEKEGHILLSASDSACLYQPSAPEAMRAPRQSAVQLPRLLSYSGESCQSRPHFVGARVDGSCGVAVLDTAAARSLSACASSVCATSPSLRTPSSCLPRKDDTAAHGVAGGASPRVAALDATPGGGRVTAHIDITGERDAAPDAIGQRDSHAASTSDTQGHLETKSAADARARSSARPRLWLEEQPSPLPPLGACPSHWSAECVLPDGF
jgi:hypothetical protein